MKGYSGDSRFYFGDELRQHFRDLIEGATNIQIATAWLSNSDLLSLLLSPLQQKTEISVIVGVGGYSTDPIALKRIGNASGFMVKVYEGAEPPLFHPKLYVFQRQHWQRVLVGSMNLTRAGTTHNIESVFSFEDKSRSAKQEFERLWNLPRAVPFEEFDLETYQKQRASILAAVKGAQAAAVLEEDVVASADAKVKVDPLREGWGHYFVELKAIPETHLNNYWIVLDEGNRFVQRDWTQDLDNDELKIMFGTKPYYAFGDMASLKMHQDKFQGAEYRSSRLQVGDALKKAKTVSRFEQPLIEKIVDQLLGVDYCGPALATRLLVLARPDMFAVVNEKSFGGLQQRFDSNISVKSFSAREYSKLLDKIQNEEWCRSPKPTEPAEQRFWEARVALLDPLVYKWESDEG